jgi:hypothetical protein
VIRGRAINSQCGFDASVLQFIVLIRLIKVDPSFIVMIIGIPPFAMILRIDARDRKVEILLTELPSTVVYLYSAFHDDRGISLNQRMLLCFISFIQGVTMFGSPPLFSIKRTINFNMT